MVPSSNYVDNTGLVTCKLAKGSDEPKVCVRISQVADPPSGEGMTRPDGAAHLGKANQ